MLLKNLKYTTLLWLLFEFLIEINCQMIPNKQPRSFHTATLVNNKLYILAGDSNSKIADTGKDFFYLDVSVPFNTKNLLWKDLSSINIIPAHDSAASVNGGSNNNTLFLYGGISPDATIALVYTFDPKSVSWSIPKITGNIPIRKERLTGIIDRNGKMYLWGGTDVASKKDLNDMPILDTINLSWGQGSLVGAPTAISGYNAVLLPNNNIIYMGK